MGLGKTMQALAVAHHLAQEKPVSRILVIAPVSILENWQRETQGATSLSIHMAYGAGRDQAISDWEHRGGIAFTSYQTLRRLNLSDDLTIDLTVIDEAHKVKNPEALQTQAAASALRQSRHRLLMSGTPLENRAAEFMFLCSLANHDLGDSLSKQFGDGETAHLNAAAFRQAVAPGYLRRNQVDVLTELPEAIIQNESVALTGDEVAAYRQALATRSPADARRSVTIGLGATSSKMIRLQELLEDYAEEGRKVLVFSSFLSVLDVASEVAGPTSLRIDGSVPTSERQRIVDEFSNQSGFGVLVMQIDVGGVGLNIQAASVVIIAEPQWKPSTETQAIGRSFRMGQTRRVNVHRLLAANSIDERIEERQRGKERIFNAIVRSSHLADSVDEATDNTTEAQGLGKILAEESERLGI
jgi:SNF2 family DNA or RNA helicase